MYGYCLGLALDSGNHLRLYSISMSWVWSVLLRHLIVVAAAVLTPGG